MVRLYKDGFSGLSLNISIREGPWGHEVENYDARKTHTTTIFGGDSLATIVCRIVIVIFKISFFFANATLR